MDNIRETAVILEALRRLGFESLTGAEGVIVYRHPPSETFFLFPATTGPTLTPLRAASIRRLVVGRGAATEEDFDRALGTAARSVEKREHRTGRRAKAG